MLKFTNVKLIGIDDYDTSGLNFVETCFAFEKALGDNAHKEITRRIKLEISYRKHHRKIYKSRTKRIKPRKQS